MSSDKAVQSAAETDTRRQPAFVRPSTAYALVGGVLGLGAPIGFLTLGRVVLGGRASRLHSRWRRAGPGLALGYMSISTPLVFALFGWTLGRREEALRASSARLTRLREEFGAVVAHDLRNPIQAMMLQLDLLLREEKAGSVTVPVSALTRLRRGGQRLGEMVNDLLDASRIEAARLSLSQQPISIPDATRVLVERIRPTLGPHDVDVDVCGAPPVVRADPTRLDQILTNLIENAAKYSSAGAPISIRIATAGSGVCIDVADRGVGISADEVPKLFDRFYQTKRAREQRSGLGLGLYITKGLVEAHGGHISVQSQVGRGTIFSVWLPSASAPTPGLPG